MALQKFSAMNKTQTHKQNKAEYGDFQTPLELARKICRWLKEKGIKPEVLVEPTCGRGSFILAALETFTSIKHIYGVDIYEPYLIETKNKIDSTVSRRNIHLQLIQENVFHFPFDGTAKKHQDEIFLILGNPPWITNSFLSKNDSKNLPAKSNIKNVPGIEALTGKGNFDIGESITLTMLKAFAKSKGYFAFLVKTAVIKNIVQSQRQFAFPISELEQINIDAKKDFDASVDAGLFFATFGSKAAKDCSVSESFDTHVKHRFGWTKEKFVADIERYQEYAAFDGVSPTVWRQGLKHDCSSIMELTADNNRYKNKLNESVNIEADLVYPLLKSSDLKDEIITETKRFVIVPQTVCGQNTDYLKTNYSQTFAYLDKHRQALENRKSIIYKNKPPFSIFGIGDYSFKPYKVAISGLYKQTLFSLVLPIDDKPVMLDDTCYFLGFDSLEEASLAIYCLNQPEIQNLLCSIVFWNAKRVITKEILMRLDYGKVLNGLSAIQKRVMVDSIQSQRESIRDHRQPPLPHLQSLQ
jgi:hypothetical protein